MISFEMIFNKKSITQRAEEAWDSKTDLEKIKSYNKYKYFLSYELDTWLKKFSEMSNRQKFILIKGELIRTYDALPNIDKTTLKNRLHLSMFATKWYKLPNYDKKKIINYLLS